MLALADHLDLTLEHLAEEGDRREGTVHEDASPAPSREGAHDQEFAIPFAGQTPRRGALDQRRTAEDRFHAGLVCAAANPVGRNAPAAEHRDRREQDRLARTRLSRDDREPLVELEFEFLDDRQVLDPQRTDQRRPQPSLVRSVRK